MLGFPSAELSFFKAWFNIEATWIFHDHLSLVQANITFKQLKKKNLDRKKLAALTLKFEASSSIVLFGWRTCRSLSCRSRGSGPRSWRACGWWRWWSWTGSSARGTSWKSCWCFCQCRPPDPGRLMRDRPWVSNWTENLNNWTAFVNFSNLDVTHGLDVWIPTYIC